MTSNPEKNEVAGRFPGQSAGHSRGTLSHCHPRKIDGGDTVSPGSERGSQRDSNGEPVPYRFPTASDLGEKGAQRAADHADRVEEGWSERAYSMLTDFASTHRAFMTEEVRAWATDRGLPLPPSARAWGAVILRASRKGVISAHGYSLTKNRNAHGTPATVWRSNVLGREAA